MVFPLAFYSEDPDGVGDAVNVFLFLDLFPVAGLEAALLTRQWDGVFGGGKLTSFSNTSFLLGHQNVALVESWDEAASQIKACEVFCAVFLVVVDIHPSTTKMMALVK